ncbi:MAG: hypothetical protein ACK5KK_03120 [Microbacterium sp.]
MERDRADRGLTDATQRAAEDVRGLVKDGPARFVNEEIAALTKRPDDAAKHAERWAKIAEALTTQAARHEAEDADAVRVVEAARKQAEQIRASVSAPLMIAAERDGHAYAETSATKADADERLLAAPRFGKSKARRAQRAATERADQVRARLRECWGSTPEWHQAVDAWVSSVTDRATEHTPEVTQAAEALNEAEGATRAASERHRTARRALLGKLYGAERVRRNPLRYELTRPEREAQQWARSAQGMRAEIAELQSLPLEQAAARIRQQRVEAAAVHREQEQALAARADQMRESFAQREAERRRSGPQRSGPSLGL